MPIMKVYHNQMITALNVQKTKETMHQILNKKAIDEQNIKFKEEQLRI